MVGDREIIGSEIRGLNPQHDVSGGIAEILQRGEEMHTSTHDVLHVQVEDQVIQRRSMTMFHVLSKPVHHSEE